MSKRMLPQTEKTMRRCGDADVACWTQCKNFYKEVPVTQMNETGNFISNQSVSAKGASKIFKRNLKNGFSTVLDRMA